MSRESRYCTVCTVPSPLCCDGSGWPSAIARNVSHRHWSSSIWDWYFRKTQNSEKAPTTLLISLYMLQLLRCALRESIIQIYLLFAKTRRLHKLSPHDSVVAFRMQSKLRSSRCHLTSEIILVTIAALVLRSAVLCSIVRAELLSRRHNKIEFTQYFRISTLSWGERRGRAPDYQVWFGHHSSPTPTTSPTCLFWNWEIYEVEDWRNI